MDDLSALVVDADASGLGCADDWLLPLTADAIGWLPLLSPRDTDLELSDIHGQSDSSCNQDETSLTTPLALPALEALSSAMAEPSDVITIEDSQHASSESDTASPAEEPKVAPNRSGTKRPTRKKQLEMLRDEVAQLTEELGTLKKGAGLDLSTPVARIPKSEVGVLTVAAMSCTHGMRLWKKLAARQRDRRRHAEDENRALREAISLHSRRAKMLRQMMQRRAADEQRLVSQALHLRTLSVVPTRLADDEAVFQHLTLGMDQFFAGIDNTFRQAKMHKMIQPGRDITARGDGLNKWVVEVRDVNVLPFDFRRTDHAMWRYQTDQSIFSNSQESRNSFQFTYQHPIGAVIMQQRKVARRYCEANRTVIIIRELTEPTPGVAVYITTHMVIRSGPPSVAGPTSIVEMIMSGSGTTTAKAQQQIQDEINRRSDLTDVISREDEFGESLWDKAVTRLQDSVESLLIKDASREAAARG